MSKQPKKPYTKPSDESLDQRIVELLRVLPGAINADELRANVLVDHEDNPAFQAFKRGDLPYHKTCGAVCSWEIKGAWNKPASVSFTVYCGKCLRSLMEGEINYAANSE